MTNSASVYAALALVVSGAAVAHPGGLDARGCHTDRKAGDYHCHNERRGQVTVIDGDTIDMHGTRIRLEGVDAVESSQSCKAADGERWPCGRRAAFALADFIGSQPVACFDRGKDKYGRVLAVCFVAAGEINDWLVRQGWAVAYRRYSMAYLKAEDEARNARRNIWSGSFTNPETYRHR